ncbi:MAG: hypothetical protein ACC652_00255 [Acidimicrobiales bacterium]
MANYVKMLRKSYETGLVSNEEFIAALFVQPKGSVNKQLAFAAGGLVGLTIGAAVEKSKAKKETAAEIDDWEAVSLAARVPRMRCVMALTNRRLLFFELSSRGRPVACLAGFDLAQVKSMVLDMGKLKGTLNVILYDDSVVGLEVVLGAGIVKFVTAYDSQ